MQKHALKLLVVFLGLFFTTAFADEALTITTYYPSPYGAYKELTIGGGSAFGGSITISPIDLGISIVGNSGTQYMLITNGSGSRMGIGTSSLTTADLVRPLTVVGDIASRHTAAFLDTKDGVGVAIGGFQTTENYGSIVAYQPVPANGYRNLVLNYYVNADGTPTNVGIGRLPTANKLEVEGNASKTAAGLWLANSDIRIKSDVQEITNALKVIGDLKPVKFHYTDKYRIAHPSLKNYYYYNFIAQEFKNVFPDSVQDDGSGYLQIDTYPVIPYLVAAVKELKKINSDLEKRLKTLENKLRE